jgi:hypothetical protein
LKHVLKYLRILCCWIYSWFDRSSASAEAAPIGIGRNQDVNHEKRRCNMSSVPCHAHLATPALQHLPGVGNAWPQPI